MHVWGFLLLLFGLVWGVCFFGLDFGLFFLNSVRHAVMFLYLTTQNILHFHPQQSCSRECSHVCTYISYIFQTLFVPVEAGKNQELGRTLHFQRTHAQSNIYKGKKKNNLNRFRLKIYLVKHPISDIGIGPGQSQVPQGILMNALDSTFYDWGFRVFTIVEFEN